MQPLVHRVRLTQKLSRPFYSIYIFAYVGAHRQSKSTLNFVSLDYIRLKIHNGAIHVFLPRRRTQRFEI